MPQNILLIPLKKKSIFYKYGFNTFIITLLLYLIFQHIFKLREFFASSGVLPHVTDHLTPQWPKKSVSAADFKEKVMSTILNEPPNVH